MPISIFFIAVGPVAEPPWGTEPRFEQQAGAPPTEPRHIGYFVFAQGSGTNHFNYLWTHDLYGPAHKDFDAGGWITL